MEVSIKDVLWNDLAAFITGIFYVFVWACFLLITVDIVLLGGTPPQESAGELLLGLSLITGVAFAILRFRMARVAGILSRGETVQAKVVRSSHYQFYAYFHLEYTIREEVIRRQVWLPNTKGPRRLTEEEQVSLVLEPEKPRRGVLSSLYSDSSSQISS